MSQDFGNGYTSDNSIAIVWHIDDVKDQLEALNEGELRSNLGAFISKY